MTLMTCRGMKLGSDIDAVAYAPEAEMDAIVKKFITTKNIKIETALRWGFQRARTESERTIILEKFTENYKSGSSLID